MQIHPQTAFLTVGFLFVALPVTAWTILHRRHDRLAVALWCGGGLIYGAGFVLISMRGTIPPWATSAFASPLTFLAYLLRVLALRRDMGDRAAPVREIGAFALFGLAYVGAYGFYDAPGLGISLLGNLLGAAWLAYLGGKIYKERRFRSAGMLSAAYAIFAAMLAIRWTLVVTSSEAVQPMSGSIDFFFVFVSGMIAALYGNLGYIGMALESARETELAGNARLAREQERRAQGELRMNEQSALLAERSELLSKREEMLAALAHEVRQPLNNASAALQSAAQSLTENHHDREQAAMRLRRATTVIAQVTAALDNTLTDAALLSGDAPLARQDIDIDTLIQLAVADVDPDGKHRVKVQRETGTRTAWMNTGLMRLALRNLIANALAYAPGTSDVVVRIADSDDPLALILDVCDSGPGIPEELRSRLFARGARGNHVNNPKGHGLGLFIVRRVMEMHGGTVQVRSDSSKGLTMRLVIPQ